jgi:hypothetical protein
MKSLAKAAILLNLLLATICVYSYQTGKDEVIFVREYREYGWKEYDANAVKLSRPIQTLADFYLVEYRLDASHLTISKLSATNPPKRTMLFSSTLNRAQRQATQQALRTAVPALIQQQCNTSSIVDDGFHLDVTLTKLGMRKSFRWNGNYVQELLAFVDVITEVSPKKYRFYEPNQKEAFKESLLHANDTP